MRSAVDCPGGEAGDDGAGGGDVVCPPPAAAGRAGHVMSRKTAVAAITCRTRIPLAPVDAKYTGAGRRGGREGCYLVRFE